MSWARVVFLFLFAWAFDFLGYDGVGTTTDGGGVLAYIGLHLVAPVLLLVVYSTPCSWLSSW